MTDRWEADFTDGLNSWIFAWGAAFWIGTDLEVSLSAKSGCSKSAGNVGWKNGKIFCTCSPADDGTKKIM